MGILSAVLGADLESLPDPLVSQDGERQVTIATWPERRAEMLDLVLDLEYGTVPPPVLGDIQIRSQTQTLNPNKGIREDIEFTFGPNASLPMKLQIYIPEEDGPLYPVILRFGMGAEHAAAANERGYVFVCFEQTLLDPDTEGHDVLGPAQEAYPEYSWGSLAVWAWSASRVLDFLETRENIDTTRAVFTGHSRTGKAALLAGALDERFSIVVPNGSGAGGAALFRGAGKGDGRGAETLELITRASRFKSWFHEDFGDWANREDELPFDQHFLRALVAPRVVLSTDASGDRWAYPYGVSRAWEAAQPVFDLLGVPNHNLIHMREGVHDQLAEDFAALLNVADTVFQVDYQP